MKARLLFSTLIMACALFVGCVGSNTLKGVGKIEDPRFFAYCKKQMKEWDKNGDGKLSPEEISSVSEIDVRDKRIKSLKGIESFTGLVKLDCSNNKLTYLDISKNTVLKYLNCQGNPGNGTTLTVKFYNNNISDNSNFTQDDWTYNGKIITINYQSIGPCETMYDPFMDTDIDDSEEQEVVDENYIYDFVEQMPRFPGRDTELKKFLNTNVRYPKLAKENGISGTVVCRFVVEKDGSITNVTIIFNSPNELLSNEAIRLIKSMPKWIPGKQNGVAVRVNYRVPVVFRLQEN